MKINNTTKRILCCLLALLLFLAAVEGLTLLLGKGDSQEHFGMFYEHAEDLDLLFFGSSHMLNAAIPMQLWHDYGISSYVMAYGSCRMSYSYWLAMNALRLGSPELMVIDCAYIHYDEKLNELSGPNHMLFDSMPISLFKLEALSDLYDKRSDFMNYLFPLTEYHTRWSVLEAEDFSAEPLIMGQALHFGVRQAQLNMAPRDDSAELDSISLDYLIRIIEECRKQGVDVLLTYIPFQAGEDCLNEMAFLYSFAQEHGLDYIDPYTLAEVIDSRCDYVDSRNDNSHLNFAGAVKFTDYIGRYVRENFPLPDHRQDEAYSYWDLYYEAYLRSLEQSFADFSSWQQAMSLLSCGEFAAVIQLRDESLLENAVFLAQLENLDLDADKLRAEGLALMVPGCESVYGSTAADSPLYTALSAADGGSIGFAIMSADGPMVKII